MARYSEHDTDKIYQVAQSFRDNCLLRDGSLLFDGATLWRTELLERIHIFPTLISSRIKTEHGGILQRLF